MKNINYKIQILEENYRSDFTDLNFRAWVVRQAANDPGFFRWLFDTEGMDFELPREHSEEYDEFIDNLPYFFSAAALKEINNIKDILSDFVGIDYETDAYNDAVDGVNYDLTINVDGIIELWNEYTAPAGSMIVERSIKSGLYESQVEGVIDEITK